MNSINLIKNKIHPYLERKVRFFFYRRKARRLLKKVVHKRGYQIINKKIKRSIKSYAKQRFGSTAFWPWLSLYTEVRGEFKEGWLPNDYYMAHLLKKHNPESIRISDYKTFDHKMFPDFALKPLLIKIGPYFYDGSRNQIGLKEAENILYEYDDEVVLKEDEGFGGHSVNFIESRKFNLDHYSSISNYIIQPLVCQHDNLRLLNNKAVSSVRILTYLNKEGEVEVKYSYLRFATGESRVDNTTSGGGFCFVKSNGDLVDTARSGLGIKIGKEHPDSGTAFKSVTIPQYGTLLNKCKRAHKIFPYSRFIGWDVAVDKSGEPVLLEWNLSPLIWLAEALEGPFFKDDAIGDEFVN